MNWPRALAALLLFALVGISACGPRNPDAPPENPAADAGPKQPEGPLPPGSPIDPATVEAWTKAGFELESAGSVEKGELPGFRPTMQSFKTDVVSRLPAPAVPFSLNLAKMHGPAQALKPLTDIPTLARVGILNTSITDDTLEHFAAVGFHRLSMARAADGRRPTSPEEVTELYLALSSVTDNGLKHLAGLKNLTSLGLSNTRVTDAGLKHLAALTSLTTLGLQQTAVTDAGLAQLAGSNKRLASLNLVSAQVTDAGLKHLAGLPDLTALSLSGTPVTDAGLVHLAGLTNLTSLGLSHGVTDKGLKHLTGLKNLTTLDLSFTQVKYDLKPLASLKRLTILRVNLRETHFSSVAAVGLLHALPQATAADGKRPTGPEDVAHLDLHDMWMGDDTLEYFAAFRNLTSLDLSGTGVRGTGLKHLAGLTRLTTLKLGGITQNSEVTDEGLKHLATLTNLTHLSLKVPIVTDEGLRHLAGLTNITTLKLNCEGWNGGRVTEGGLKHLSGLTKLTDLNLAVPGLNDAGIKHLAALKNLKLLTLKVGKSYTPTKGKLTEAGIEELQKALPNCRITRE